MSLKQLLLFFACFLITSLPFTQAQISQHGTPLSLSEKYLEKRQGKEISTVKIPLFDKNEFKKVKAQYPNFVFEAAAVDTKINLQNSGEWELMDDGSRVWRAKITAEGAKELTLMYDEFWLPKDSKFFLYTENERQVLGAFTHQNNKASGKFSTAATIGETVYLEYYEAPKTIEEPKISINKVFQKLPSGRNGDGEFGFNTASACHINVNCEQGEPYQEIKRGVVRIVMFLEGEPGTFLGYCSGALMNNTAQDETPYLLTAFHCIIPDFTPLYNVWQFDFGYEVSSCDNPATEPERKMVVGAELVAGKQDPDFLLLKIANPIPSSYAPFYCGWNRAMDAIPQKSAMIHHPCGDVKKVTVDNNSTATIFNNTISWEEYTASPSTHFQVNFDEGFSQIGASGSPLIGDDGLVYGQLHGGNVTEQNCNINRLFYGRLATSWDDDANTARLKDWLDPTDSGVTILSSLDPFGNFANVEGQLQTPTGEGIAGVTVEITSPEATLQLVTDENGQFSLQLPRTAVYTLAFSKAAFPLNGVTTFDLIQIRRHILGAILLDDAFKEVAADANFSGGITTFDILVLQKLILGIDNTFVNDLSWGFVSPQGNLFNILTLNDLQAEVNLNIIGLKIGDVNGSADPKE